MGISATHNAVFITGSAKRIGKALALHLAAQGYHVAVHYHHSHNEAQHTVREIEALGVRAIALPADLATDFDAHALITQATQAVGPLTCLINNASLFTKDTVQTATAESFHQHTHINTYAPLALINAFAKQATGGASIINIGDGALGWSYSAKYITYALSKMGLMGLATLLAPELAPRIRINNLALGPTLRGETEDAAMFDRLADHTPLKQLSSIDDICRSADYLLATPCITGQTIYLNGGMQCHQLLTLNP